jgi:hypothetical protein
MTPEVSGLRKRITINNQIQTLRVPLAGKPLGSKKGFRNP